MAVQLFNAQVNNLVGGSGQDYELLKVATDDDTDTIFYTENFPIADMDGDGVVGTGDVQCFDDRKDNTPATLDVSAIDFKTGKITLASPATSNVYGKYYWSPFEYDSQECKTAFAYFVSMLAFDRIRKGIKSRSMGGLSVTTENPFTERWNEARDVLKAQAVSGMIGDSDSQVYVDEKVPEPRGRPV